MAEFAAMMLWTDAYLADTLDLTTEQHGAYLLLLMLTWRQPSCSLPNDPQWLKTAMNRLTSMHGNKFNSVVLPLLSRFFELGADGRWSQKRLRKERDFARKRSRIARESAEKRWAKASGGNGLDHAPAMLPNLTLPNLPTVSTPESLSSTSESDPNVESDSALPPKPAATPRKRRKRNEYSAEFERLWGTYPRREEDGKADCWKIWQTAIRSAEPEAIIASAAKWHAEHHDNEFRFGLRRWLKGQKWLEPVPPRRREQSDDFALSALRDLAQDFKQDDPSETNNGPVLQGACDGMPDATSINGTNIVPFGGRGQVDILRLSRRADPLLAASGDGGMFAVGATEIDMAEPVGIDRVH